MAKSSVQYVCSECGWNGPKWYGRCPECGQWGTVEEFHEARPAAGSRTAAPGRTSRTQSVTVANNARSAARPITEVGTESVERLGTGFSEFDRVLGGGVVPGSVTLIAGEPGYRQVDIAVADGRQYRARCGGRQYVPRGRSAVCPTVGPGAGQRIEHGADAGQRIINTRQHRAVHFRRGITGAGSFARFPHQCGGAELVTGLHHRPVHSIGADRTEQAGLGHCGFGADHRLAGGRWHFRRFDSGARSGKRADRYR